MEELGQGHETNSDLRFGGDLQPTIGKMLEHCNVIFVNENENVEKRENNEFVNENENETKTKK